QRCLRVAVSGRRLQYRDGLEDDRLLLQPGFVVRVVTERKLDHLTQPHVALCRVGSAHGAAVRGAEHQRVPVFEVKHRGVVSVVDADIDDLPLHGTIANVVRPHGARSVLAHIHDRISFADTVALCCFPRGSRRADREGDTYLHARRLICSCTSRVLRASCSRSRVSRSCNSRGSCASSSSCWHLLLTVTKDV